MLHRYFDLMTLTPSVTEATAPAPFELKGSLFTLTVLQLRQTALDVIAEHLAKKIAQAPGFFHNTPVVIDLVELDATAHPGAAQPNAAQPGAAQPGAAQPDFGALCQLLRSQGLIPVAVRNGPETLQDLAKAAGLGVLPNRREPSAAAASAQPSTAEPSAAQDAAPTAADDSDSNDAAAARANPNRLHAQPVRSGQRLYAAGGDLVILGPVSHGAEVMADGNVHVYGPLRGRALAGVKGDRQARIFCQSMEAQLIAVAGNYRLLDEPAAVDKNQPTQIYLADEKLIIAPIGR